MNYIKYSASNDKDDISVEFISEKNIFIIKTLDGMISLDKESMYDFRSMITRIDDKSKFVDSYPCTQKGCLNDI